MCIAYVSWPSGAAMAGVVEASATIATRNRRRMSADSAGQDSECQATPCGIHDERGEAHAMPIVDAQVHIWANHKPTNPNHRQVATFSKDQLLAELDEARVEPAVIHPPPTLAP